jgi:4-hydroxybenzoate polyprenyltransferase
MALMSMKVHAAEEHESWLPHFSRVFGARSAEIEHREIQALIAEEDSTAKAHRERRRALIVPREHGAWGLLLVPMITGAGIALRESSNLFPFLLLLTAALTLFWLRTPLESYLGTSAVRAQTVEERRDVLFAVVYLAAIAGLALAMLLREGANPLLWYLGLAAAAAFGTQALIKTMWKQKTMWMSRDGEAGRPRSKHATTIVRMLGQVIGTVGLTASAPAAYYVMTGKFGPTAWLLWLANLLFAGNQIHYVQLRIHSARAEGFRDKLAKGWAFAAGQLGMAAILIVACYIGLMPWIVLVAYVPLVLRGYVYFLQKPQPLAVRRLGWNELAQAVAFCVLFISALALHP